MSRKVGLILLLTVAIAACPKPPSPIGGVWRSDGGTRAELRLDENLQAEVCLPTLGVSLRVATATVERDAFNAYHLRVSRLDSALNAEIPPLLVRALTPTRRALTKTLSDADYLLRFCRVNEDANQLTCDSLIGSEFNVWHQNESEKTSSERCVSTDSCVLGEAIQGLRLLECPAVKDAGITLDTPLCEAVRRVPEKLYACLARDKLPEETTNLSDEALSSTFDQACKVIERIVRLDDIPDPESVCDLDDAGFPTEVVKTLCDSAKQILTDAGVAIPKTEFVRTVSPVCGMRALLTNFELDCCSLRPALDGGQDGGTCDGGCNGSTPDAGRDGGDDRDGGDGGCICLPGFDCDAGVCPR